MAPDLAATGLGWLGPHFPGPHLLSLAGPSARPSAPYHQVANCPRPPIEGSLVDT